MYIMLFKLFFKMLAAITLVILILLIGTFLTGKNLSFLAIILPIGLFAIMIYKAVKKGKVSEEKVDLERKKFIGILGIVIGSVLLLMYIGFVATVLMQGFDYYRLVSESFLVFLIGGVVLIIYGISQWKSYKASSDMNQ